MSITYPVCVFTALGIKRVMRMRDIVVFDLPGSAVFAYVIL